MPTVSAARQRFADRTTEVLRREEQDLFVELRVTEDLIPLLRSAIRNVRREIFLREREAASPRWRKNEGIPYPDACPRCPAEATRIIRAGFTRGKAQMFRCRDCNSTWVYPKKEKERIDFALVCRRCGGTNTKNGGPGRRPDGVKKGGGRRGFCFDCGKGFLQGGAAHLEKNSGILRERIKQAGIAGPLAEEIFQDAALRILAGEGYAATLSLRRKEAAREVFGEWRQLGSDHPEFRRQQGQKVYKDQG